MRTTKLLTVLMLTLGSGAAAYGSVDFELLIGGSDHVVLPSDVSTFTIEIRLHSDVNLDGLQFSLTGSDPSLFEYATPTRVTGGPWTAGEATAADPSDGDLLSTIPDLGYFTATSGGYPASAFPSVIETVTLAPVAPLTPGATYTFTTGAIENGTYNWVSSGPPPEFEGQFGDSGLVTIEIAPEPATLALLAFGACGVLRRRSRPA